MTLKPLSEPVLVRQMPALKRLAETLLQEPVVAVDTESNSLYAYQEQVCLIQFSTRYEDYLVDPLALDDLSPLGDVFCSSQIEKIFHAAEYDLICLKRDFDFEFENLFDTMIAARILGKDGVGLGTLIEAEFGIHLDKRYQRANWGQRPLPAHLLAYAQQDTHYLIPLRKRLAAELKAKSMLALASEDFTRATVVNGRAIESKPDDCWRIRGSYDLEPQQAAVLHELCRYRDQVARSINRPLFKVIGDQTLLKIAQDLPASTYELKQVQGMTPGQMARHSRALLAAVGRGLRGEPKYPPRANRPSDAFLERLDRLRNWRKTAGRKMGVSSDVVLPRDLMYLIAENNPRQMEALQEVLSEVPWRYEHFGSEILAVLGRS